MFTPKLSLIITLLTGTTGSLIASPIQPNKWELIDNSGIHHEYQILFAPSISCGTAASSLEEGWHLATITSEEEQLSIINALDGLKGEFWLGGYQAEKGTTPEDNWEWVTGEQWEYTHWAPGEPNDAYGSSSEQHIAIWSRWGTDWKWNDEGYLPNITGYVTEKSHSVPEPSMFFLLVVSAVLFIGMTKWNKNVTFNI